jgi:hypothetical protein
VQGNLCDHRRPITRTTTRLSRHDDNTTHSGGHHLCAFAKRKLGLNRNTSHISTCTPFFPIAHSLHQRSYRGRECISVHLTVCLPSKFTTRARCEKIYGCFTLNAVPSLNSRPLSTSLILVSVPFVPRAKALDFDWISLFHFSFNLTLCVPP